MESKQRLVRAILNQSRLLIEPVWNRNRCDLYIDKLVIVKTFNRTSMESKLRIDIICNFFISLLIEPVWNRNLTAWDSNVPVKGLLIEPVWNRNAVNLNFVYDKHLLLIEPVWNRNYRAR